MDDHIEPHRDDRSAAPAAVPTQSVTAEASAADSAQQDGGGARPQLQELPPPPPAAGQPTDQAHQHPSDDEPSQAAAGAGTGGDNGATAETAAQHDVPPATGDAQPDSPAQSAAQRARGPRHEIHELSKANLRDMVRRLMVGVPQGLVSLNVSKEMRELAKSYLAAMDEDTKDAKARPPIDVSQLRSMAQHDSDLLHIIAPLLSDEEMNEVVNGSQDPAPG